VRPQLRVGLNTGAAVVGKVQERADVTVLGDTVNFASRLQALAYSDSVFMSESTHRLVQGLVEASFAGEHTIKGKAEPQKVFRLDALRVGATRFEAAVSRGLSTFVGREREMEVLERGLDKARSELRVTDIAAEPGMESPGFSTSFASESAKSAPLSYQETARLTVSRRRSSRSSKWCAAHSGLARARPRGLLRKSWKWD